MYKVGAYIIYKKDVCKVKEMKTNPENNENYYILIPIEDISLKIEVPIENKQGFIRPIISKDKAQELIKKIPIIEPIQDMDNRYTEKTYKELYKEGTYEDLIKIIKTTYIRNNNRIKNNKKKSEKDDNYFQLAEKTLYNELAISLNKSFEETKEYIINKVTELIEKNA